MIPVRARAVVKIVPVVIPNDTYRCVVVHARYVDAATGTTFIWVTLKIVDGSHAGERLMLALRVHPDNDEYLERFVHNLDDVTVDDLLTRPDVVTLGCEVLVRTGVRTLQSSGFAVSTIIRWDVTGRRLQIS